MSKIILICCGSESLTTLCTKIIGSRISNHVFLFCWFFFLYFSFCRTCWCQICHITKTSLELFVLLPVLPKCWHYRCVSLCPAITVHGNCSGWRQINFTRCRRGCAVTGSVMHSWGRWKTKQHNLFNHLENVDSVLKAKHILYTPSSHLIPGYSFKKSEKTCS